LPVINGFGQSAGRNFNAKNVKSIATDKEVSLAMDIAPSYPKEAGIASWNRLVRLNKPKNLIEISDDYALSQVPDSLKQVL
jgi:hypothetical protein